MSLKKENCIICEELKEQGFFIIESFICLDCEKDVLNTDIDSPYYYFIVKQMSKINKIALPL